MAIKLGTASEDNALTLEQVRATLQQTAELMAKSEARMQARMATWKAEREAEAAARREEAAARQEEAVARREEVALREKEAALREKEAALREKERKAEADQRKAEAAQRQAEAARREEEAARREKERQAEAARREEERQAREKELQARKKERLAAAAQWRAELAVERAERKASQREAAKRLRKAEHLFTNKWGRLIESLVDGDLVPLLTARGVKVVRTAQRVEGELNGERSEFDIVAVNGEEAVVVEVKTTLESEDVAKFLDKLSWFKDACPDYRRLKTYGAVAYLTTHDSVITYAQKRGLFVIRATGSSARIINPPEFKPRPFPSEAT